MRSSSDASGASALVWDDVRFFLAVAREGGLSPAARTLGVEHSTVARRISQLEDGLRLRLFDRLPRRWSLTQDGRGLLDAALRLESEALAFTRAAVGAGAGIGVVRISAPPALAGKWLMPRLCEHAQAWHGLSLELLAETRSSDLYRREAEIALRLSRPSQAGLTARRAGTIAFDLYGTREWLDRSPAGWQFAGYADPLDTVPQMEALARFAADRPFVLRTNDLNVLFEACRAGLAVTTLPAFLADGDRSLTRLPGMEKPLCRDLWIVVHPDVRRSPQVRRVADLIARLAEEALPALRG